MSFNMPKEQYIPKNTVAWCPYCGKPQEFGFDSYLAIPRCTGCGITVKDFYVRKANQGFWKAGLSKFAETVQRLGVKWERRKGGRL